jgi:hypothetical protein
MLALNGASGQSPLMPVSRATFAHIPGKGSATEVRPSAPRGVSKFAATLRHIDKGNKEG